MLSWAQRRTIPLRLVRKPPPRKNTKRSISLPLPRVSIPEVFEHQPTFALSKEPGRGQRYSTTISPVTSQAVALLKENRLEEVVNVTQNSEEFVPEVVDKLLASEPDPRNVNSLFTWMESFPDATNASSDLFHQVFDRILEHETSNQMLVPRFGILCASKGYEDFVATHISPVVSQGLASSEFEDWKLDVDRAAIAFKTFRGDMALEEESLDYHLAELQSIPSQTILHMVEETLPSILPEPSPNDHLIFEDQGDEYASPPISADGTTNPQFRAARMLKKLFLDRDPDEAYRFLLELRDSGITPAPSRAFYFAAYRTLEALLSPDVDSKVVPVLRQQYTAWLQLVPDNVNVRSLTRLLFHAPIPDLVLVSETATILTAKGHGRRVIEPATRILYQDPSSTFGVQFLRDLEATSWRYCAENPTTGSRELFSDVHLRARSTVIKAFARFGRFEEAIELLPDLESDTKLPISVYDALLHGIQKSNPTAASKYMDVVRGHRLKALAITDDQPLPIKSDITLNSDKVAESNLASSLRYLMRSFKRGHSGPHPQELLAFMEAYLATGRTYALTLLFNKAASTSHFHTATFLYAEMMFYFRHGEYDAVLETVVDHFYLGNGIPRPLVLAWERDRQQRLAEANPKWKPISSRFITGKRLEPRTKIWPASSHTSLLWQAVALRTKDYPKILLLYKALMQSLREGRDAAEGKPESLRAHPNLALPESSAFVPFLRKIMNKEGFEKGPEILNDMISVGLTPTVAHFTEIAHQYARAGETKRAMMILERLENSLRRSKETGLPPGARNPASVFPDVAMYVSLMRAFIDGAKNPEAAEEVARRLEENLGWDHEYPPLQDVMKDLEELKLLVAKKQERRPRYA